MDRTIKSIINALECPICKSQIDGIELHKLYCASDPKHYQLSMYANPTIIESDKIQFSDNDFVTFYKIIRKYNEEGKLSSCIIYMEKPGVAHKKTITIDFDPLNINPFSIDKVIKRVKNIFIFQ